MERKRKVMVITIMLIIRMRKVRVIMTAKTQFPERTKKQSPFA